MSTNDHKSTTSIDLGGSKEILASRWIHRYRTTVCLIYLKRLLQIRGNFRTHKSRLVQSRILGDSLTPKGAKWHLPPFRLLRGCLLHGVIQRLTNILQDSVFISWDNGCNTKTSGPAISAQQTLRSSSVYFIPRDFSKLKKNIVSSCICS